MTFALTHVQRALLLFLSASGYLAWFSGVGERGEAQGIAAEPPSTLTVVRRSPPPAVAGVIVRDPFAGAPGTGAPGSGARGASSFGASDAGAAGPGARDAGAFGADASVAGPRGSSASTSQRDADAAGTTDATNVPDIAGPGPAAPDAGTTAALVVRATIAGDNPVAYVASANAMDIVRVGDRLGERRIVAIDLRGVAFADGTRLDLADAYVAPQAATASAVPISAKLDALRHLLESRLPRQLPAAAANPAPGRSPSPSPLATPAPAGTFPTPGPLPTVDRRGVPAGTNPTPDASGPTPFPEPYPYPPATVQHH